MVDINRAFKFLAGLYVEFDEVCRRIIGKNPLPPTRELFAKVRCEESQRQVMLGKRTPSTSKSMDNSTLLTSKINIGLKISPNWGVISIENQGTLGRHVGRYIGKPPNGKRSKIGEQSNHATPIANEAESNLFSKEQMDQLLKLLKSHSSPSIPNVLWHHK